MAVDILRANETPDNIEVFMSTARGNATFSRYDTASAAYYDELYSLCGIDNIVTLHQIHSSTVIKTGAANRFVVDGTDGDGLFSVEEDVALGVLTADCYPVMLAGACCTAALHCGWRGTVNDIITKAFTLFDTENDRPAYAFVGAGICKEAYEVKSDFIDAVSLLMKPDAYLQKIEGKWHFDLKQLIVNQLKDIHVAKIEIADKCTFYDKNFHSYRRDGAASGRMITGILRRKGIIHKKGVQ